MEPREKKLLGREAADLIQKLGDRDARRLRKALATTDGAKQFVELLSAVYRLPLEQRQAFVVRLEQINTFRSQR
jgi:hypothetical protein